MNIVPVIGKEVSPKQEQKVITRQMLDHILDARNCGDNWIADHRAVKLIRQLGCGHLLDWSVVDDVRRHAAKSENPHSLPLFAKL
jgi:hypothetical protein